MFWFILVIFIIVHRFFFTILESCFVLFHLRVVVDFLVVLMPNHVITYPGYCVSSLIFSLMHGRKIGMTAGSFPNLNQIGKTQPYTAPFFVSCLISGILSSVYLRCCFPLASDPSKSFRMTLGKQDRAHRRFWVYIIVLCPSIDPLPRACSSEAQWPFRRRPMSTLPIFGRNSILWVASQQGDPETRLELFSCNYCM